MRRKGLVYTKCIIYIILISLLICSCGKNDDLPEGAEYFEPIWFENLTQYCTGNYNNMYEFKNGYAVVSFAQMGEYWSVSDERSAIIDKSGEIIIGPLEGDLYINVIDDESFYIQYNDAWTSKIVDINNDIIGSFDGNLLGGASYYNNELFNEDDVSYLAHNNGTSKIPYAHEVKYGLVRKTGQVLVPCKYSKIISNVTDKYFVFLNDEEGKSADVYNSDGSFSHSIYSNYAIREYKSGMLEIYSDNGYGVSDIYGNVIIEPDNKEIDIMSKNCIITSRKNTGETILMDSDGNTVKNLGFINYDTSEMYDDTFMVSDYKNTYLMTSKGKILSEYENTQNPEYCGDGVFSYESGSYSDTYVQLVDGKTGKIIGERYSDRKDIKFDEGYAVVEDLAGNIYVIDSDGNKYCEGYNIIGDVSDRVVRIYNDKIAGIICLPRK